MSTIICAVCKHEILGEAFKFDDDLGGFVHTRCKPVCSSECQNWTPIKKLPKRKRVIQTFKKPVELIKKIGEK